MSPIGVTRATMLGAAGVADGAQFFVGSFTKQNTTGTQAVTGVGFTPKAIIFWTSGSDSGSGVFDTAISQAIGFTSGPTESYCVSGWSQDGVTTSDASRRISSNAINLMWDTPYAAAANLSSFDADGFTLEWVTHDNAFLNDKQIMFLAIGGTDVSAKVKVEDTLNIGNKSHTGFGFQPDVVLFGTAYQLTAVPASSTSMGTGVGCMDASGNQWAVSVGSEDIVSPSDTYRYQDTAYALAAISPIDGSFQYRASFVSMDADGFTLNWNGVSARKFIALALDGVSAKAGSFTTQEASGTHAITGVGFQPACVLGATTQLPLATTVVTSNNIFTMGAMDGVRQKNAAHVDQDALSTTTADSYWQSAAWMTRVDVGPSAFHSLLFSSFNADGFTYNKNASGMTTGFLYLALG